MRYSVGGLLVVCTDLSLHGVLHTNSSFLAFPHKAYAHKLFIICIISSNSNHTCSNAALNIQIVRYTHTRWDKKTTVFLTRTTFQYSFYCSQYVHGVSRFLSRTSLTTIYKRLGSFLFPQSALALLQVCRSSTAHNLRNKHIQLSTHK